MRWQEKLQFGFDNSLSGYLLERYLYGLRWLSDKRPLAADRSYKCFELFLLFEHKNVRLYMITFDPLKTCENTTTIICRNTISSTKSSSSAERHKTKSSLHLYTIHICNSLQKNVQK